jgi:N utilization substance protein A
LPKHNEFGRIAAQTAKQVIIQRIREAERDVLFKMFKEKEGQLLTGTIQQIEGATVIVNLGKTNSIMPTAEQIPGEHYYTGQRLRFYLKGVEESVRGPRIIISRSDPGLVKGLFQVEVPEVLAGSVEIMGIAREAGSRSKVAVKANDPALDPIGSCVGQRGTRIQAILSEVGQEKIDIILFDKNIDQYIKNALSPAKIDQVKIVKKTVHALVYVPEDQLSLAIGRGGQNVRLASRLTGFTIDIEKTKESKKSKEGETRKESKESQADRGQKNKKGSNLSTADKITDTHE